MSHAAPNASLITGVICGYFRVEEIEEPLTQKARYLDKLVDELAKGRKMEKNPAWFITTLCGISSNLLLMKMEKTDSKITAFLVFVLLVLMSQNIYSQSHILTIKVLDSVQQPVSNATIKINQKERLADSTGIISTILPNGRYRIAVSAVGHHNISKFLLLINDTSITVYLRSRESLLQNVIVTGSRNILRNQMSVHSLDIDQIQKLPVILGEGRPVENNNPVAGR